MDMDMEREYYFITDKGFEVTADSFEEAEIFAENYCVDWLTIKTRLVPAVDCAARDGNC